MSKDSSEAPAVSLDGVLGPAVSAFALAFAGSVEGLTAEQLLELFGKETPIIRCSCDGCSAPVAWGQKCVVHFVVHFLGFDTAVAISMLMAKGVPLPKEWQPGQDGEKKSAVARDSEVDRPFSSRWKHQGMMKISLAVDIAEEDFEGVTVEAMEQAVISGQLRGQGTTAVYPARALEWLRQNFVRKP